MTHVSDLIELINRNYPEKRLLKWFDPDTDHRRHMTGAEFAEQAVAAAKALVGLGIATGEAVGIYSPNLCQVTYTELGIFATRAVSVPLYPSCSPEQVAYIALQSGFRTIFVGGQLQYNNVYQVQREKEIFEHIVIFDPTVVRQPGDQRSLYYTDFIRMGDSMRNETTVRERHGEALPSDLALLIYTSGTTGEPKGVKVLHSQMLAQIETHHRLYPFITASDKSVSFLPLSHIFEKMWFYFCLSQGVSTYIVTNPKQIVSLMPRMRPTVMCNVPRYWEKVYIAVQERIENSPLMLRWCCRKAVSVGQHYFFSYRNVGKRAPIWLALLYWICAHTAFLMLKRTIGIERGRFFPVAGAALDDKITRFLRSVGIPIIIGYGLSESCATVAAYSRKGFVPGSVGQIIPGLEVRLAPNTNEIELRGKTITPGYYNNPEADRDAFTEDGWFRTGDAGRLDGNTLFFVERLKDLYKTANGKYIAPRQIEAILTGDPYFEQVAVIADGYRFVSALIYPNWKKLRAKALQHGVISGNESIAQLAALPALNRFLMAHIEPLQGALASFEKIKRITLLAEPFTIEKGELTPTLKLKRKQISRNYALQIAAMYREEGSLYQLFRSENQNLS